MSNVLTPVNITEALKMAEVMAGIQMVPKDYQGKPANVLVAVQMGMEVGFGPVQSLQNIAVINGRPSIWGDGLRALVMSAPDLGSIEEDIDDGMVATCKITRIIKGKPVSFTGTFSKADAENAQLWGRNTWKAYPKRMLQWRAFGFAARDAYADRLKGIQLAEEVIDIPASDYQEVKPETKTIEPVVNALPEYPQEKFTENKPGWVDLIQSGRADAEYVIANISTKYALSEVQKQEIRSIA